MHPPKSPYLKFVSFFCAVAVGSSASAEPQLYTYDSMGRLIQVERGSSPSAVYAAYIYDKAGNRTNTTVSTQPATPPAVITFSIGNASVTEGGLLSFTVAKSGSATTSFSVNYGTGNGSAAAPGDYTASSSMLTFAASETAKNITIATIDDTVIEGNEDNLVTLSAPTGGASLGTSIGTGTILDNDVSEPPIDPCLQTTTEGEASAQMLPPQC